MKASHVAETVLARALTGGLAALPWHASLAAGAALGETLYTLGVRRRVAEANLAGAFPERTAEARAAILRATYRELGRVAAEYGRLGALVHAPPGEVVAAIHGIEHLEAARGRGAIIMTGHYGNFELLGAVVGKVNPLDFVVRPLSNPGVETMLARQRAAAGVGRIDADTGARAVYAALRSGRWVAMLADQDARRMGTFVPFLGRLASTPVGPARIALATGAPIIMGFGTRRADGRLELDVEPPLAVPDAGDPDAVRTLTLRHVRRLEFWVRRHPEMWFWLHRRWKTVPPPGAEVTGHEESA